MAAFAPPDNTPILVGAGQYVLRDMSDPAALRSPIAIAALAAERALADCAARVPLAPALDVLAVVRFFEHSVRDRVLWPNPFGGCANVPWAVARRLGARPRRAIYAEVGGQTPQRLVNRLAEAIHAGELSFALLTGAEAIAAIREATRRSLALDWREDEPDGEFEDCWPAYPMVSDHELRHGVALPIQVYALFEQVRRHALGRSLADYRADIGALFAPFSAVASANPHAQFPRARTPEEIAEPGGDNYLVCEPYTRWMVAQDAVNQGAAVVLSSVGAARAFGIPESRWVHLRSYADVDEKQVSLRPSLAESPAQRLAIERALAAAGLEAHDLAHIDLYSCFPIAVTTARAALGLDGDPRALTLTGGLPYFGGPGNNYSMHAIAEMVARLRAAPDTYGAVVANGGYLSKHSVGVYSGRLDEPWLPISSVDQQQRARGGPEVALCEAANGPATIESYAASYHRSVPAGGLVVARMPDGRRSLAVVRADDEAMRERLFRDEVIGGPVTLTHADGVNRCTA